MEIILVGTRAYQWAVPIFAHLFAEHWGDDPIIWYGDSYDIDLPANVVFRRVPCYSEDVWPWDPWFSNGLRSIMADLAGFTVALFLPDHWISQAVDHAAVAALREYMERDGTCVRGNLTAGTCLDAHGRHMAYVDGHEIVSVSPADVHCGLQGGITFCPSLWTRGLLRDAMAEPHWNLWQAESEGTQRLIKLLPAVKAVGVKPGPVHRCHGLRHANVRTADFTGLSEDDFQAVRGMVPDGWRIERY